MRRIAVIPAYNEAKRIASSIIDAGNFVEAVVVVDDCSGDNTAAVARQAGAIVLRHRINRGQGAALQTGTDYALSQLDADMIIHFDADGQMQGKDIPAMIEPITQGKAEVVLGSRFLGLKSNMPVSRRLTLKAALIFTKIVSGINITDPHCGFRALSRRAAEVMHLKQDRMAHASEILDLIKSNKLMYVSVPVEIKYTQETLQKGMSFWQGFAVLRDYFTHKFMDIV